MTKGERIKQARIDKGLTQEELASLRGYKSKTSISKLESEDRDIPRNVIESLARVLEVSPSYLMGWDTPQKSMSIATKLKLERVKAGLSQKEMAGKLNMPLRTYGSYERGEREVSTAVLQNICKVLGVSSDYMLDVAEPSKVADKVADSTQNLAPIYVNILPIKLKRFPLLGEIACGEPIFADEDRESYIMADMDISADFCLRAKGDSMINARIYDGDIVFIQQMPIVDNGEIAAVIIDDEATLKKVYYYPDKGKLILCPENSNYEPLVYIGEELDTIRILGKAVYFMSAL
ncbi:MAG: helix-turn-helix domain-containing protein [Ruminococcus sp.]|nr:helix-turn-helix domain-containing protein [Ruminococcus sp.]